MQKSAILGITVLLLAGGSPAQSYSLAGDWSDTSNPNGPWACLGGGVPLPSVANWSAGGFPFQQPAWAEVGAGAGHIPSWMKMAGIAFYLDISPGEVMMHSWDPVSAGSFGEAEVTWTAPAAGLIDLAGSTWLTRDIGRSNDWSVNHNGNTLRSGTVFSGDPYGSANPFDIAAGAGSQPILGRPVAAGDVISFRIIRTPGHPFGDFNAVHLTITLTPALNGCGAGSFSGGGSLLTISGSTGLPGRVVSVGVNQPFTLGFAQPAGIPFAAPFMIFGRLGVPAPGEAFPLPLGIGTVCFMPALLSPFDPTLFTIADSFTATGILPATPAPWAFPIPGLPSAVTLTLQGVTYATPSTLGLSNGLVLNVF